LNHDAKTFKNKDVHNKTTLTPARCDGHLIVYALFLFAFQKPKGGHLALANILLWQFLSF
jgi:hypothetical protein